MWFFKHLLFLSVCVLFSACGFHPLYTPRVCGSDVSYPLKIATIPDRGGQVLRNYLVDLLTPAGAHPHPRYILSVALTDTVRSTGVNKDETTSRKEAVLNAILTLKDTKTNAVVYTHSTQAINSFSVINENYYSDLVAEEYAKKEAARLLAEKITLLLTTYIDTHP